MGIVDVSELHVNFAHPIPFPKTDSTFYPFGTLDEQIIHHTEGTIVENIIPGYLAISVNCKLGRDLRQIAHLYQCVDIQQYDKILIHNPNAQHCEQSLTLTHSLFIYFAGIYCTPAGRYLIMKIV